MIDSGSSLNCVGPSLFQKLISELTDKIVSINDTALTINGETIRFYGTLNLEMTLGDSLFKLVLVTICHII